jgi:uncharacterized protein YdaT
MPWTKSNYPNSLKNLPAAVRNKAIEIANALLIEGEMANEGIILATAISRAKDWAVNRGISIKSTSKNAKTTDVKKHGEDRYVAPIENDEWAVKKEGAEKNEKVFTNKSAAVKQATKEAQKANASVTIQKRTGKIQKRISYNPRNTGKK